MIFMVASVVLKWPFNYMFRYVDALNDIFSKAQSHIDDLNLMCIASAELDKFDVDMEASGKSAQFARIEVSHFQ